MWARKIFKSSVNSQHWKRRLQFCYVSVKSFHVSLQSEIVVTNRKQINLFQFIILDIVGIHTILVDNSIWRLQIIICKLNIFKDTFNLADKLNLNKLLNQLTYLCGRRLLSYNETCKLIKIELTPSSQPKQKPEISNILTFYWLNSLLTTFLWELET